jgi:hypothetical protein
VAFLKPLEVVEDHTAKNGTTSEEKEELTIRNGLCSQQEWGFHRQFARRGTQHTEDTKIAK